MSGGENALYLEGEMQADTPWYLEDGSVCAPDAFRRALEELPPGDLRLYVNSCGGDVSCGVAMYEMLRAEQRRVTGVVFGVAYSSATLPLCACDEVLMSPAATLMIHEPAVLCLDSLTSDDCERISSYLGALKEAVLNAYVERTSLDREKLRADMKATRFMTAEEAIAEGWADGITEKGHAAMSSVMRESALAACMAADEQLIETLRRRGNADERREIAKYAEALMRDI